MLRCFLISKKKKRFFMNPLVRMNAVNIINDGINQSQH